jgi:transcriptional regulator with XRE-family HTH domain
MDPAQSRAARALLDWSQPKLAEASGLGLSTVVDFERSRRSVPEKTLAAIRGALEAAGVRFIDDGEGVCVTLKKPDQAATIAVENLNAENDE